MKAETINGRIINIRMNMNEVLRRDYNLICKDNFPLIGDGDERVYGGFFYEDFKVDGRTIRKEHPDGMDYGRAYELESINE